MDNILEVKNLNCIFNKGKKTQVNALKDVSFELQSGECLGIIGESGSGKSTTARIITRLVKSSDGDIVIDGRQFNDISNKELYKMIQMVFQTPTESFNPRLKLGVGVGESLRNKGLSKSETRHEVERLLVECGLPKEYYDKYPYEVSGGECQRAAIARALVSEPKILICDEATSSLDVTVQKEIIALLNSIREKKGKDISIIFISHDIALVQHFCDRVVVMNRGEVVEQGNVDEIIMNPKEEYTKKLIDSVL